VVLYEQAQARHTACPYFSSQLKDFVCVGGGADFFWAGAANALMSDRNKIPKIKNERSSAVIV
jgi:hypothetical protein